MTEHQHTEWKETWRDEFLKWICAFANAEGGILVIGRNDKGMAVGVPNTKKLLEERVKTTQETIQETTREKLLSLLGNTPRITRRQLAEVIGISEAGVKYHLDKLRAQGIIRHVGSTKAGKWEIIK